MLTTFHFLNIASRLRLLRGGMDAEMQRRMERLQKLTQEVCGGLDPNDPVLRKYFEKVATDCYLDDTCLALMLTCSFLHHEGAGSSGKH